MMDWEKPIADTYEELITPYLTTIIYLDGTSKDVDPNDIIFKEGSKNLKSRVYYKGKELTNIEQMIDHMPQASERLALEIICCLRSVICNGEV